MNSKRVDHSGTTDGFVILQWFFLFLHVCLAGVVLTSLFQPPGGLLPPYRLDTSMLPAYFIVASGISLVSLLTLGACLVLRSRWGPSSFSRHFYVVSGVDIVLPALVVCSGALLSVAFAHL